MDASCAESNANALRVVASVEQQVPGSFWAIVVVTDDNFVDELFESDKVGLVGAAQQQRQWNALAIDQDVLFRPAAAPVDRRGADQVPPFGALVMKASALVHCQSMPLSSS